MVASRVTRREALALAGLGILTTAPAAALDWPSRPLRVVVGFSPGGGVDLAARLVTRRMAEALRQTVLVENRPGAGGTLAATLVARAEPDGHTLMVAETGMMTGPALLRDARYDPVTSFALIARIATAPLAIAVPASLGVTDLAGAVARGRAAPNPWRYATPGMGTAQHLAGEMLRAASGLPLEHVPYRGGAPAVTAAMSGEIEMVLASLPSVLPAAAGGSLRLLAVTGASRVPTLPAVPTVAETLPGFEAAPPIFLVAPSGTPAQIVAALNAAVGAAIGDAAVAEALLAAGLIPAPPLGADATARELAAATERWLSLARASGARLD